MVSAPRFVFVAAVFVVLVLGGAVQLASAGSCADWYQGCRNTCDAEADAHCSGGGPRKSGSEAECVGCRLRAYYSCKEPCDKGCGDACDKVLLGL
jgi:hypothetical protein